MITPNQINPGEKLFPGRLNNFEKECLFSILPENKTGYSDYRKKISSLFVIGMGRFGETNLILGKKDSKVDLSIPSSPVFAVGKRIFTETEIYIVIHEEVDNQIEFDISNSGQFPLSSDQHEISRWSYSEWIPGNKAPGDNSDIREINIIPGHIVLVIASLHKKLWIYEKETGINHLIPITNFYNELMKVMKIKDPQIALKSDKFFQEFNNFSDKELSSAFLLYNKFKKKIDLDYSVFERRTNEKSSNILNKIFKRG